MWASDREAATAKAAGVCFISAHPQYVPCFILILTPGHSKRQVFVVPPFSYGGWVRNKNYLSSFVLPPRLLSFSQFTKL